MLGWHISVFSQADGGACPARFDTPRGQRLAVWQAGPAGLDWLDQLVAAGQARSLGGNGYPNRYTAPAAALVPVIVDAPPHANKTWISGYGNILTEKWEGTTVTDRAALYTCPRDEWLLIEAWDES